MSIAYEINRLQTSKADTKEQVNIDKDYINAGIDFIGSETVDDYDEKIQEMQEAYKAFIPVNTTSDTQIDAPKGGTIIGKTLKGNTSQSGTPTPSSPVPVNNVTGEQVVKVCGKNIFDEQTEVGGYDGTTGEPQTNNACRRNINAIRVEPSTRYIFTRNGSTFNCKYFYYDINYNFLSATVVNGSITTPSNCYYMNFHSDQLLSDYANLQIEKGSSASDYQEYQGKDYEINLGANLLDIQNSWVNNKSQTSNGLRYILNEDDTISISGTSTNYSGAYARSYNSTDVFITLKANHKYRLLVEVSNKTSSINSRVFFGTANANISDFSILTMVENGIYYKDYVPTEDIGLTQYSVIGAQSVGETSLTMKIAIYDITINVINKYTKYFTPIELNKIGNYQDYIRKGTGKNLFDKSTATLGKGVNTSNGNLYNDSSLFTTDFIEVKTGGVYYTTNGYSTSANRVYGAQYDSNKQYIASIATNAEIKTFYISNASTRYIRLTGFISEIDTYQLEERKSSKILRTLWL